MQFPTNHLCLLDHYLSKVSEYLETRESQRIAANTYEEKNFLQHRLLIQREKGNVYTLKLVLFKISKTNDFTAEFHRGGLVCFDWFGLF